MTPARASFSHADTAALTGDVLVKTLRWGPIGPDTERLVAELPGPMRLVSAETAPGGMARRPGPLRVTLDPGHGGLDPGAQAGGLDEADLMLTMAEGIAAVLRAGGSAVCSVFSVQHWPLALSATVKAPAACASTLEQRTSPV